MFALDNGFELRKRSTKNQKHLLEPRERKDRFTLCFSWNKMLTLGWMCMIFWQSKSCFSSFKKDKTILISQCWKCISEVLLPEPILKLWVFSLFWGAAHAFFTGISKWMSAYMSKNDALCYLENKRVFRILCWKNWLFDGALRPWTDYFMFYFHTTRGLK